MFEPSAQVSRPAGLGGQSGSRVWPQRQGMIAPAPSVRSLGRNLPLQPWNSMWLSMIALVSGVCALGYNTPCPPSQMCNSQCNEF